MERLNKEEEEDKADDPVRHLRRWQKATWKMDENGVASESTYGPLITNTPPEICLRPC